MKKDGWHYPELGEYPEPVKLSEWEMFKKDKIEGWQYLPEFEGAKKRKWNSRKSAPNYAGN